jgi:(p)ppGpp synthase/HD superfamily hydrolase
LFAFHAHNGQKRKYTNNPYFFHTLEVATVLTNLGCSGSVIAAGFLHDVLEDTSYTYDFLVEHFGESVANYVNEVTDVSKPEDGNREIRKARDRAHLAKASIIGRAIKLADMISNTLNIRMFDEKFSKIYLPEKRLLLPLIKLENSTLYNIVENLISEDGQRFVYGSFRAQQLMVIKKHIN